MQKACMIRIVVFHFFKTFTVKVAKLADKDKNAQFYQKILLMDRVILIGL